MGESDAEKRAKKSFKQAVGSARETQEAFLQDPTFLLARELATKLLEQPGVDPDAVRLATEQGTGAAHQGAQEAFRSARAGLALGPGVRSGATNLTNATIASQLGEGLAQAVREPQLQLLFRTPEDIYRALAAAAQLRNEQFGFARDITNAYQGAGAGFSQLAAIPDPLTGIFGGIGAAGGSLLGNPSLF